MDPMLLLPLVLLGAMLIFMWRGNKKRAEQQATLREQMVVGADVMTQAGIYGTIVDIDRDNNVTTIETSPGVNLRVHSATILNVLTPTVPDDASALATDDDGLPAPTSGPAANASAVQPLPADEPAAAHDTTTDDLVADEPAARDTEHAADDDVATQAADDRTDLGTPDTTRPAVDFGDTPSTDGPLDTPRDERGNPTA